MKHFKCSNPSSKYILKNGQEVVFDACGNYSTDNKKIAAELEEEIESGNQYLYVADAPATTVQTQDAPVGRDFGQTSANTQTHIGTSANMLAAVKSNLTK